MTTIEHGYATARIRGMKSQLLERTFFERLIGMKNLTEMIVALEQTVYKKEIHEAVLQNRDAEGVEIGLKHNIITTFNGLRHVVDGRVQLLVDILLGRWDTQNLKTILRGAHHSTSSEEIISSLVPAGSINGDVLEALAGQGDVRGCLNLMVTWSIPYARPLTEKYFDYIDVMNLQMLEFALDKFYFERSLKQLNLSLDACLVKEILKREIDAVNIMTLLRLTREKTSVENKVEFFLPGGKQLRDKLYAELAASEDIEDIVKGMAETTFGVPLERGWQQFMISGRFSQIERSLEAYLIGSNVSLFRANPLSVAVIIAFIWAKLNEVVNLRIVVRGQSVGMPEEKIREALVFV